MRMLDDATTATVRGSTALEEVNLSDDRLDLYERIMLAFEYRRAELIPLVDRAVEEANDNRGRAAAAEGLIRRAEFHGLRGEIEKGDADLAQAEEMIEQASSTDPISVRLRALLLSGKAHYLYEKGKPHESTEASYRALELGEQLGDRLLLAEIRMHIGVGLSASGDSRSAKEFKEALRLSTEELRAGSNGKLHELAQKRVYSQINFCIGASTFQSGDPESAAGYFLDIFAVKTSEAFVNCYAYAVYAEICIAKRDLTGAIEAANESRRIAELRDSKNFRRWAASSQTKAYFAAGKYSEAIEAGEFAVSIPTTLARNNNSMIYSWLSLSYARLAESNEYSGSQPESLLQKAKKCLENAEEQLPFAAPFELNLTLQTMAEAKMVLGDPASAYDLLKRSAARQEEFWTTKVRNELGSLHLQLKAEREQHEKELEAIKRQEIERQLSTTAMNLASQTELLASFREDLHKLVKSSADPSVAMKQVLARIKTLPCEQIDWLKFESQFIAVHPEFKEMLQKKYPDLTKQEVKMCQLARLGLRVSDMAQLLCLSERSIESHRYSLRKKLGLSSEQNLTQVLHQIE